jgi:cell wall-associated NlpC family hydrolase
MKSAETPLDVVARNSLQLVEFAMTFLGTPFSYVEFNCWHFVKRVYEKFSIPILPGSPIEPITDFGDRGMGGRLVLLKRRNSKSGRRYTHVAMYIGDFRVIHNTRYMGGKVVINTMDEVSAVYQVV